jgi:flagellar motor component MotA
MSADWIEDAGDAALALAIVAALCGIGLFLRVTNVPTWLTQAVVAALCVKWCLMLAQARARTGAWEDA